MEKKKMRKKTYRYTRLFKQEVLGEIQKENLVPIIQNPGNTIKVRI